MYQLTHRGVIRLSDQAFIPESMENPDWVEFQAWVNEGGVARPAPPPGIRVPSWNGADWEEGENPAVTAARDARNAIRSRLRADIADPGLRGGMPELANKVQDIVDILNEANYLRDE